MQVRKMRSLLRSTNNFLGISALPEREKHKWKLWEAILQYLCQGRSYFGIQKGR